MHIKHIEIQNFRKLKAVRIDFATEKTIFVGANNSGKTTAMVALRRFLVDQRRFDINDFTISSWKEINKIGRQWETSKTEDFYLSRWEKVLPTMDVWLDVSMDEIHYVQHLLPTLDWNGGLIGVRLRLQPQDQESFRSMYLQARQHAVEIIDEAKKQEEGRALDEEFSLWPANMREFLSRGLAGKFCIRSYILDPAKIVNPENNEARPQELPVDAESIQENPFENLILINEINAQRGFSDASDTVKDTSDGISRGDSDNRKLSNQLRAYYTKHLDPTDIPEPSDVSALDAISKAQKFFDERLEKNFHEAFKEIQELGYPGIREPSLKISTRIKPMDGLNHSSALQYEVIPQNDPSDKISLRLPEQYNGLGYQNLISMVFRLMSFRDDWMQVGKVGKRVRDKENKSYFSPPLHLVLIEEPEAHLHVQVQQVFIRKAYDILRNHEDLKDSKTFSTQLIVSTHSGHIAHECEFDSLRYFRRMPADKISAIPTSVVVNLSTVFGTPDETAKFVTRYLKASHCDLFFADAAIFIEGAAEKMLIPHFIQSQFQKLNQRYITLLEVGGSHAHRFRSLIEYLGLTTLIITDIDATSNDGKNISSPIKKGSNLVTRNMTLKEWLPKKDEIDDLLEVEEENKVKIYTNKNFSICVAYQCPVKVILDDAIGEVEIYASTFEDALAYDNLELFRTFSGGGLFKKFQTSISTYKTPVELSRSLFENLRSGGNKAEFALELLYQKEPRELKVPAYIYQGLKWLEKQVCLKEEEILGKTVMPRSITEKEVAQ